MYDVHIIVMMMEVIQTRASVSIQFRLRYICSCFTASLPYRGGLKPNNLESFPSSSVIFRTSFSASRCCALALN